MNSELGTGDHEHANLTSYANRQAKGAVESSFRGDAVTHEFGKYANPPPYTKHERI